tara:strand:- start:529 stop:954 length:426 start_codon:yes stop_codon:yes gene_type:complete
MTKVNTGFVLEMFRREYATRINEVIGEADAYDEEGNMVLSPDLKVRHKKSGLEYTIDNVEGEKGELKITLRSPESPRFEPAPETRDILGEPRDEEVLGEQDGQLPPGAAEVELATTLPDEDPEEVTFTIDQSEFEDDYEVD